MCAITDKTWLKNGQERSGIGTGYARGGREGFSVKDEPGAVDGNIGFVVCGGLAVRDLAVARLEENVGMSIDACVTEVEFSNAADVIDDMAEEMEIEGA